MKTRLLVSLLLMALLLGVVQVTGAASRPTIVAFESSLKVITLPESEAGKTTTTLTWHTADMTDEYRLTLHAYVLDKWEMVFPQESVPLEASGARVVTIFQPLNFGPPTYLLSIISNGSNAIIDQRILTIPYDTGGVIEAPMIDSFTTDTEEINAAELQAGTVRVMVKWSVGNRVPASNLVFEQVLDDESSASVELPRLNLFVPSEGEGPVAPSYREGEENVTLRLRVIDVISGSVYAEKELVLPIVGEPTPEPPVTDPTPTPAPPPQPNTIMSFSATPGTVNPGAAVTLAWEVVGTGGVVIEQRVPNITTVETVVNAASPKGTALVYVPGYAAYSVQYTLYTADRSASREATVQVYCPTAFFFGAGDGCPTGPAREVGTVYQAFEGGFMVWRQDTNEIYVMFKDGSAAYFLESDYAGLPEAAVEEAPPLDRQIPVAGFGKVWANGPNVRSKLGWALDDEQGYNARIQSVASGREPRPQYAFYLTLPGSEVVGSGYGVWGYVGG